MQDLLRSWRGRVSTQSCIARTECKGFDIGNKPTILPLAKLMIAKGVITEEEFKAQLSAEQANYLAVLKRLH